MGNEPLAQRLLAQSASGADSTESVFGETESLASICLEHANDRPETSLITGTVFG